MAAPRSIIIDADPSPDDAIAIMVALASPEDLDVLAVTTVAGNVPLELTSKNARKALELIGRTRCKGISRSLRATCQTVGDRRNGPRQDRLRWL